LGPAHYYPAHRTAICPGIASAISPHHCAALCRTVLQSDLAREKRERQGELDRQQAKHFEGEKHKLGRLYTMLSVNVKVRQPAVLNCWCCAVLRCAVLSSAAAWLGWAPWGAGDCGAPPSPVQLESLPTPPQTLGLILAAWRILVVAQGGGGHLLKQLFELHGIKKRMYNNTQLSIWANHSGRRD
jgi:hypothetical protein